MLARCLRERGQLQLTDDRLRSSIAHEQGHRADARRGRRSIVLTPHVLVLMASICVFLGPVFLGPSLIFGSATILLTGPILRIPRVTVVLHLLIIGVPLALELLGVLPRTFSLDAQGSLVLKPWAIDISQLGLLATLLGQVALQLIGNAFVLHKQRVLQDEAQRQLHVQAWQLKQLVPAREV